MPITSSAPTPGHSDPIVNPTPSVTQVENENPQTLDELSKNPSTTEKRLTSTVCEDFKRTKNPDDSKIATCTLLGSVISGVQMEGLLSHGFQFLESYKSVTMEAMANCCLTFFDHHNFTRTLWDCQALLNGL
ncbi:hypothetical protein HHK36_028426 [Tetracentron sinense]|uniref:Uncharacterized protein n=1 Tax=Tetracentron sinense TaxID=13715 RepID=A0A834YGC1_TETSI|nr:hypothetical protein HHK36_028426 [Tetracentron sinense]